jgi:uncharacterized delta-60 repeat protein
MKKRIECLIALILMSYTALAQSGSVNVSFGTNGKVTTGFGRSEAYGNAVAVQPDGKIICGGSAYLGNTNTEFAGDSYSALMVRYNADGSRDASFGNNGVVVNKIESFNLGTNIYTSIYAIQVLNDGKILTYGYRGINEQTGNVLLSKYNADGSKDNSFGNNGFVDAGMAPIGSGVPFVIQSDNKIVVLGSQINTATNSIAFHLERYTEDGTLDNSFGSNGQVLTTFGFLQNSPTRLALQVDGKILACGNANAGSGNARILLARYNTDGTLDNTFDGDGKVVATLSGSNSPVFLSVAPNGKIRTAGYVGIAGSNNFSIAQFNSNGSVDLTFDGDGRTLAPFDANDNSYIVNSISQQADGKLVVNTQTLDSGPFGIGGDFLTRRYNSDGTVDLSFGNNGQVITFILPGGSHIPKCNIVQDDSKILVAGYSSFADLNVLRYNSNGTLDNSFNEDGITSEKVESSNDNGRILVKENNGKLLLIGTKKNRIINTLGSSDIAIAKYNQDGSLDDSFGVHGKSVLVLDQQFNTPRKAALQPDGKILVLNEYSNFASSNNGQEVVRFNSDGSLDSGFGINGKVSISTSSFSSLSALHVREDGGFFVINHGLNPIDNSEPFALYITSFSSDGSVNTDFGNGGTAYQEGLFVSGVDPEIAVQPDGKIILSTYSQGSIGGFGFALFRFNSDGTIDTSFENEVLTINAGSAPFTVFLEPDGKILVAGSNEESVGFSVNFNFITARYNSNGSLDSSYGTNGVLKTFLGDQFGSVYTSIKSIQRQTDGKLLVGLTRREPFPTSTPFESYDFAVYRFNTNGEYDNSFGSAGKVFTSFFTKYDELFSMVLQDDHKIVLAGTTDNGVTRDFALVRLENCINVSEEVAVTLCAGETYSINGETYSEEGIYSTVFQNMNGCDSTVTTSIFINEIQVQILIVEDALTAVNFPADASLQWVDCDNNFSALEDETSPQFNPLVSGNYAVVVSNGECSVTSDCLGFTISGLDQIADPTIKIFPNPTSETLTIESPFSSNWIHYNLLDNTGRKVMNGSILPGKTILPLNNLTAGFYTLQLLDIAGKQKSMKIIKQ